MLEPREGWKTTAGGSDMKSGMRRRRKCFHKSQIYCHIFHSEICTHKEREAGDASSKAGEAMMEHEIAG